VRVSTDQLFQRDAALAILGHQARRDAGQFQAALHDQGRNAKVGRNVLNGPALVDQGQERLELIGRVHVLALHVLGQAHGDGAVIGHDQARNSLIAGDALAFNQQTQRGPAPPARHDLERFAVRVQHDDEVLQQAHALDAVGQGIERYGGLAHVALGQAQMRKRDKTQLGSRSLRLVRHRFIRLGSALGLIEHGLRLPGGVLLHLVAGGLDGGGFSYGGGVHDALLA